MDNPSYYAIIPAEVRYSKIKANAKLLYGEITALSNKTGECYASNWYFAELYWVSEKQVSLWIKELVDNGFCTSRVEVENGNKRFIAIHQKVKTYTPKGKDPYTPKGVHNNTRNNTKKKSAALSVVFVPPTENEVAEFLQSKWYNKTLAKKFYDHYSADNRCIKGWKPMENRKKAVAWRYDERYEIKYSAQELLKIAEWLLRAREDWWIEAVKEYKEKWWVELCKRAVAEYNKN